MAAPTPFTGFNKDTFQLFRDLAAPENNNTRWFDVNRWRYEQNIVGQLKSLLETLKPVVLKLNPQFDLSGKTNGNFSRINRDIRFSNDKSPYKLNYYLYLYDQRRPRDGDGRLYVGVSGEGLTVGFSIYAEWRRKTGDVLKGILRKRVKTDCPTLESFLKRSVVGRYESYWYSVVDKEWVKHRGWPKNRGQWEELLGWVVRRRIKPREATRRQVLTEIQSIFQELYPLYVFSALADRHWLQAFKRFQK